MPTSRDPLATLAHPLRARLHGLLRVGGPSTASRMAAALGTHSGATSYHLRILAKAGLVEDAGDNHGRERRWRALERQALWAHPAPPETSETREDDEAAAELWLDRDYLAHMAEQGDRWLDASGRWPARWREAAGVTDGTILVTSDQLGPGRPPELSAQGG